MSIKQVTNDVFKGGWVGFHDLIVDLVDQQATEEQAKVIFEMLPDYRQEEARDWGIEDTEFLTQAYSYFENDTSKIKAVLAE
ncbi:hypothetical protein HB762_26680 (plasmid) [Vibrio campbellii]|uniref:CdiI immunity protein domain-containing protein n=1 Tax=Vibrio campbellii TaxID=680 RepID=A0ABY5IL06_9VIBR|nr:hypothetical protein [Vibrio campbellii]EJO2026055.1 hypothetical protein [Vibrio parahaemolyticus]UTZ34849.1 hypothetical protein HB762_26680 [Vibrio campbellii]